VLYMLTIYVCVSSHASMLAAYLACSCAVERGMPEDA
jgi:hypothetical protein